MRRPAEKKRADKERPSARLGENERGGGPTQFGLRGRIQTYLATGKLAKIPNNSTGINAAPGAAHGFFRGRRARLAHM